MNIETVAGELLDGDVFYFKGKPAELYGLSIDSAGECWTYVLGSDMPVRYSDACQYDDQVVIIHNTEGLCP